MRCGAASIFIRILINIRSTTWGGSFSGLLGGFRKFAKGHRRRKCVFIRRKLMLTSSFGNSKLCIVM
jgi:hypothetical protein